MKMINENIILITYSKIIMSYPRVISLKMGPHGKKREGHQ